MPIVVALMLLFVVTLGTFGVTLTMASARADARARRLHVARRLHDLGDQAARRRQEWQ